MALAERTIAGFDRQLRGDDGCDNILSGYLCAVTTVFSQQDGIYGFKFPKRFLEISSRDLTLFSTLLSILI